ncbi:MAG TPA: nucleotidyltransferase domain-containing protein [Burkholderiales bacterium]|nr:nucleotidyltransferase domain-containing protein [Burkholderiales bacterium]
MGLKATGLGDVLFGKTRRRVLELLFGSPDRSFYVSEIMRVAESGIGAVHRELAALEAAGLVSITRIGNQKHYRANRGSPIFEELRGIVLKTFGAAGVLRETLAPLAPKISAAFVYGSLARGTDTAASDIDLMVVGEDVAYARILDLAEKAERRLGRKVNPTVYSRAELQRRIKDGNAFANRVIAQPKIFVIGSEDALRSAPQPRRRKEAQG